MENDPGHSTTPSRPSITYKYVLYIYINYTGKSIESDIKYNDL